MICAIVSDGSELKIKQGTQSILRLLYSQIDMLIGACYNSFYVECNCRISFWAACYIANIKHVYKKVSLHLFLTSKNFADDFNDKDKELFHVVLGNSDSIRYTVDSEHVMIDGCDLLLLCGNPQNLLNKASAAQNKGKQFCFFVI